MTWYGQPYVYKKDDIIVISPRNTAHILDALGFDELFEFCGPIGGIRIKDKKVMHYSAIFGNTRMARLQRIAMDLDAPLQEYIKKKAIEKNERAKLMRRKRIVAAKGLVFKEEDKIHLSCHRKGCGRRFRWYSSKTEIIGRCPHYDSSVTIVEASDGNYLVKEIIDT